MSKPGTKGRWNQYEANRYSATRTVEVTFCDKRRGRRTDNLTEPEYIARVAREQPDWHKGARVRRSHTFNHSI